MLSVGRYCLKMFHICVGSACTQTDVDALHKKINLKQQHTTFYEIKDGKNSQNSTNSESIKQVDTLEAALYNVKHEMDKAESIECTFYIPEDCLEYCLAVIPLFFSTVYKIEVQKNENILPWRLEEKPEDSAANFFQNVSINEEVLILNTKILASEDFVHGFSTRFGGISTHPKQKSMNLCFSARKHDTKEIIHENRKRLCDKIKMNVSKFHVAKAEHGNRVWVYEEEPPDGYDAIICRTPGVVIAAPAADCNTILLMDQKSKACAAIHAGWKGILNGI